MPESDLRAGVKQISQPALAIAGQNDRVTPPGATRWIADSLPDARFAEIPRAGHASFLSHTPTRCSRCLRPFLAANGFAA